MTTAPDLPVPVAPATLPAQPAPLRAPLALVPPLVPSQPEVELDFDEAVRTATPRLLRYTARRLQDTHEAEEVVQEALLRAFQHKGELRTEDDLMAWLTVVTGRLVIDRLRVRGRMTPVGELPAGSRTGRDTADVVVARDEARIALDALEAMPTRQAAVLWAREVEGLSYDDIGDRYGLSEPTVRSLLHRARRTLRREYAERGGTVPAMGLIALAPWLHGLRFAGRLRDVVKKTSAGAAVVTAGLAIATVAPLWSSPVHTPAHAAPAMRPLVVDTVTPKTATPVTHATKVTVARPQTATPVAATSPVAVKLPVHHACTSQGYGLQCAPPPDQPTLYVQVLHHDVGVTTDEIPFSCSSLPTTPVTSCQPSNRKS